MAWRLWKFCGARDGDPRLELSIKGYLTSILRSDGFRGSGRTFRRVDGELLHVIQVQGSSTGGKFAVNLAVQPMAIPDVRGRTPNAKTLAESDCEFCRRLSASGSDQWWDHGDSQRSMDAAVQDAATVYCAVGRALFAKFSGNNSVPHMLTAEQFARNDFDLGGFSSTRGRMALALARMRRSSGDLAECRAFARVGLADIGDQAIGLRRDLESMLR